MRACRKRLLSHSERYRLHAAMLCAVMLVANTAIGQLSGDTNSRWSLDFRYGSAAFAGPVATLPLTDFVVGRYVELSFLPNGAPEYGVAYATSHDSSVVLLVGVAFLTMFTTLDVSDSSTREYQQGEYPLATLRISHIRSISELRAYVELPFGLGIGMWRAGLGLAYVWASGVNVLNQAKTFPGIQSIDSHPSWLLAVDAGFGYRIPGSSLTLTGNFTMDFTMEFVSNDDFLNITMAPASPYRFEESGISPIYLSVGVILDL